jgi:membrane protein DedA with SNARE-associated domain
MLSYLFYSIVTGLIWATTISTAGYWAGRLLVIEVTTFENNFAFIMLGFAALGLTIGYIVKRIAMRDLVLGQPDQK